MSDREKLIELLKTPIYPRVGVDVAEIVADFLLDNGVGFVKDINAPSNEGDRSCRNCRRVCIDDDGNWMDEPRGCEKWERKE